MSDASARTRHARFSSGEVTYLVVAVLVAALLRGLHWYSFSSFAWFDFLGLDAKYYDEWARRILAEGLQSKDPYFMGPLYPHFLAFVYRVFGPTLDAMRGTQLVLSCATVVVCHLLGRQYGGVRLAVIVSACTALYGPFIYYTSSILYPTLTVLLSATLLWLAVEATERRSIAWSLVAGLILGVYALGRGNILLFAPVLFFWWIAAWGRPRAPRLSWERDRLVGAVALTLGTLVAIAPATIHNFRTGDPTLLTTNGGLNFYIGNGPMASGGHETPILYVQRPGGTVETIVADLQKDVECRTEAERALGRRLSYTEVSSFWFDETMRFVRANPSTFLSRLVMKTVHFWSTYEIPQIEHFGYFRRFSLPLRGPVLGFGVIGSLAVVGMFLRRREWARWSLLYAFVIAYSTSIVLFFVLARYRLPVLPALLPFAGVTLLTIYEAARRRNWTRALVPVAAAAGIAWLMQANFYGVDEPRAVAQILYRHGIVEDSQGNYEAAVERYREALKLKPEYDKCHLNLGINLARLGQVEVGLEHLRIAEQLNPRYYRAPYNRGLLLEQLGDLPGAEAAYRRAVELEPRYLLARTALGEMKIVSAELEEASRIFQEVLAYQDRWQSEHHGLARARAQHYLGYLRQRQMLAESERGSCFERSASFREAELTRLRGRLEEAETSLASFLSGEEGCVEAYRALGEVRLARRNVSGAQEAFERALASDPRFPGVHLGFARVRTLQEDAESAISHLEAEIALGGVSPTPFFELAWVYEYLLRDQDAADEALREFESRGGNPSEMARRRATAGRSGGS